MPDFQLSLAIGKEGQNARLAAKLTGWKIDIKSESQLRADIEQKFFNINNSVYDEDFKEDDEEENFEENFEEISEVESKEDVDSEKDTEENFEEDNMDENIV